MNLNDPVQLALKISSVLTAAGVDHALYGALLLAAYGEPRETRDADVAVLHAGPAKVLASLRASGMDVQEEFSNLKLGGVLVSRIAVIGTPQDPGLNNLDLVAPRSERYAREALTRAVPSELRGQAIHVLSPEDFVLFKVLSSREKDIDDGSSVLKSLDAKLDWGLLQREINALAEELPDHPVRERWQTMRDRT